MRRMLAEVIESERLPADHSSDGLGWGSVRCMVKVLGSVPESHHLPADIKDTTLTITRPVLFDSEYKPGTKVILTPDECDPLVRRPCDTPEFASLRGRVVTYRTDANGDGFPERVMENAFVRVVVGPRFGARIWEIWHKRRGINVLHQTHTYDERYLDLGGQEDRMSASEGAGEFYTSEFAEKEVKTDEHGCRATYEFKSEKTKGLTLVKEILLPPDAPVVYYRCTFKYAGAEKPPEDGKPDELDVSYWTRMGLATNADTDHEFVIAIPTKSRLRRLRPGMAWWFPPIFNISAPYHLGVDEKRGVATALLFDHTKCHAGRIYHSKFYSTLEPQMELTKVPKDGEYSVAQAIVVGDTYSADQEGLAMVTQGPDEGGETPVFVLSTQCDPGDGKLQSSGGASSDARQCVGAKSSPTHSALIVKLAKTEYSDAPGFCMGTSFIPPGILPGGGESAPGGKTKPARFAILSRNGQKWELGGEL